MIHGRLRDGRLTDLSYRQRTHPDDVPLDAMPSGFGPFGYDTVARQAVPLPRAQKTLEERVTDEGLRDLLLGVLALRMSTSWAQATAAEKAAVQAAIDDAGARMMRALRP